MGIKYASIHILSKDQEKILSVLEREYDNSEEDILQKKMMNNFLEELKSENAVAYERLSRIHGFFPEKVLVIQTDRFISIYDEEISFESIEKKVKFLSNKIDAPLFYISNFDGDVLVLGVYKTGRKVTSGVYGNGLDEYGLKPKSLNIDRLNQALSLEKTETINNINAADDIEEIENEINKSLNIPFDMDADYVNECSQFVKEASKGKLNIYKYME